MISTKYKTNRVPSKAKKHYFAYLCKRDISEITFHLAKDIIPFNTINKKGFKNMIQSIEKFNVTL